MAALLDPPLEKRSVLVSGQRSDSRLARQSVPQMAGKRVSQLWDCQLGL